MNGAIFDSTDGAWVWTGGLAVDGDGSPRCYGPNDTGLDYTANGGPLSAPYGYLLNPATGKPFVQGEDAPAFSDATRGFYVSSTTYQRRQYAANDPMRYLNSETELFGVVPGGFRLHVPGVVIGCLMKIRYKGKEAICAAGDVGPKFGEGSMAVASFLGIPSSPRNGGVDSGIEIRTYPGQAAPGYELQPA